MGGCFEYVGADAGTESCHGTAVGEGEGLVIVDTDEMVEYVIKNFVEIVKGL